VPLVKAGLLILSYLIGGIPTGYILLKVGKNLDIRSHGSGNIGFANVIRTAGPFWGFVVLLVDAGKAFAAVFFFARLLSRFSDPSIGEVLLFRVLFGAAAIAGNILNPFLSFRGGKGVGTGLGVALAVSPFPLIASLLVFGATLAAFRYVSLSSLAASLVFFGVNAALFLSPDASLPFGAALNRDVYALVFAGVLCAVIIIRHASNIGRLLNGEENKLGK
jgi:acyl phosphate:glycerol-3-phosphate acyltransferase